MKIGLLEIDFSLFKKHCWYESSKVYRRFIIITIAYDRHYT